jgi:kynureninase
MPPRQPTPDRDAARELDRRDPLARFRRAFHLPKHGTRPACYLSGHSLGLMPRAARAGLAAELDRWGELGVEGHLGDGWLDYHRRFSAPLAKLVGARRGEVIAMNTLTVNLHLMLVSFFAPRGNRRAIAIERHAFPSDRYAVASHLAHHGLSAERALLELDGLDVDAFEARLERDGERIALVLLPGVQFLTGERLDIARVTDIAHRHGCRIGFDLAHAIGNVPLALHAADADFAVWCSYKYLNGGPGAVGGCFVHERWADADLPRFAGWWGHDRRTRFRMPQVFAPLHGAEGWQLSNPPIFSLAPLEVSLSLFLEAGMAALRQKSERLTAYLEALVEHELGERATPLTPRAPAARGCQLSLKIRLDETRRRAVAARLRADGVVADWRPPDVLRLAPVPLYNRFEDIHRAVGALKRALDS